MRCSVKPLPSYTRRKLLKSGQWAYYFEVPSWARHPAPDDPRGKCPVESEELGTDYLAAIERVEDVLLPQFDAWRTGGVTEVAPLIVKGTLAWLFAIYKDTNKFKRLGKKTRKLHQDGFDLVGSYVLKDGRRLGSIKLASIDTSVVDPLYEKLLTVEEDGEARERRTTVNHAMKSCRRAWNVVYRLHPKIIPAANPFSKMGLQASTGSVTEATYQQLTAVVAKADDLDLSSLGTAYMVTWEWLQREEHIFTAFKVEHYRPKDHPHEVKIVHPKNGEDVWIPLFDRSGAALFPELMARMDAMKRNRIGGLMFYRGWSDRAAGKPLPWVTLKGDLDTMRKWSRKIIHAAGLPADISFTSFRHGGMTECGDNELTDAQIRAISRHKSGKVLAGYVKRTQKQIIEGTKKRRAGRTEQGNLSE
jgi:hypothetical protein